MIDSTIKTAVVGGTLLSATTPSPTVQVITLILNVLLTIFHIVRKAKS